MSEIRNLSLQKLAVAIAVGFFGVLSPSLTILLLMVVVLLIAIIQE
jgi:hypothetical protein